MVEKNECLKSFKKNVCQWCSGNVGCVKKADKERLSCPKYANFKIYGTGEAPTKFFG